MSRFRALLSVVLIAGALAGLLLFAVQHFTIFPLIEKAEAYEEAAERRAPGAHREDHGPHPASGVERTAFTALTTVLSAIGFAALLFGTAALSEVSLNWRKGALRGLAAYVCVDLAPALGLPPQPPGVAAGDVYARQLWWTATVISTAAAIWLLFDRRKSLLIRSTGLLIVLLPHAIGAPAATGESSVPAHLIRQFALLSILTTGIFWLALGSIGGLLFRRLHYEQSNEK